MSMFAQPSAPGGGFTLKDHLGALVLIEVLGVKDGLVTNNGPADVITANVVVLDGPHVGDKHDDTIIFGKVIYGQLKGNVGQKVLGRVAQGTAKPSQSPPWILAEATPADIAIGEAWLAQNKPAVTSATPPF